MLKQNKENRIRRVFDFLHRNIIIIIIIVVVLAGAVSTVTIVRGDHKTEKEEEPQVTTVSTVYLAMDRVSTLNPLISQDSDTYYIAQLLYSSLFRLDKTLNVEKDLVDTYTTDPSAGTVSIKLKEARFSDGSDFTAYDVQYTVSRIQAAGEDSPYYSYAEKIESVSVTGNRKLTITFEDAGDAALDNLVFPIVSRNDYSTDSDRVTGSGKYCISSYNSEEVLKLKPNKYYYGDQAENKIEIRVVEDKDRVLGLMTMDAVTTYVSREQDADVQAEDKNLSVTKISSCELEYLGFNFENKHLAKKEVRQAVALSINTESLIKDDYGGAAVQSDSIYFPGFLGTENTGDAYAIDVKGASDLLKQAGYRDSNEDGILEDENQKEVSLTILTNKSRADTAASITDGLKEIGINAKVKSLSWDAYGEAIQEGEYDIYIGGYKLDKKCDLRMMLNKSKSTGYDNDDAFDYAKQLETCLSAGEQKAVFEKLKPILNEDLPYYCLCYKTYAFITVERFRLEEIPTFFDTFRGADTWEWDKLVIEDEEEEGNDTE